MVARAEVGGNHQLIFEALAALDQVVEVHVAEFVDVLFAVVGRDKRQLANENFGFVHYRVVVEAGRGAVAEVRDPRAAEFFGHVGTR